MLTSALYVVFLLFGCGFQLRDQDSSSQRINAVQLNTHKHIKIATKQLIAKQLNAHNVRVLPDAHYRLTINELSASKRLAASSRSSFNDRFLLRQTLLATLTHGDKQWPLSTYAERVYDDDRNTPSAKALELNSINHELSVQVIDELASQVRSFNSP
ncbi:MAG: hypothetical protein AAGF06_04020 [Pseudomonadota bacterium]